MSRNLRVSRAFNHARDIETFYGTDFRSKSKCGTVKSLKWWMNKAYKLQNYTKLRTSFCVVGNGMFAMASTFFVETEILSADTM
jgi:hypothetical protein